MSLNAQFIAPPAEFDSAPRMRREFELESGHGEVRRAELAVSALGIVDSTINGVEVGSDVLSPGWTSYEWRIRLVRHDVTALLLPRSVIGLTVGNGWYRGRLGWGGANNLYGQRRAAYASLTVTFADGYVQEVVSGSDWTTGPSAVLADDLYDGQTVDGGRQDSDWLRPGFSGDESWTQAEVIDIPQDILDDHPVPGIVRHESLGPQHIWKSPRGRTLVDFGQNLVGWVRIRVQGPKGAEVVLRHAEVLEEGELGVRPLRSAKATDRFILSGGYDTFEPTFTFHGFRYAEVEGWPGELAPDDIEAVVVGSDLERIGTFECSDSDLNRFHQNVVWGMRGNFLGVPTDCPQRDERLGWTGDIAAFAPTACFLFDVRAFLSDWLRDLRLEQAHNDGVVPFVVPDVLKRIPAEFGNSARPEVGAVALWSDASVWVPWAMWEAYGDIGVLNEQFESQLAHVQKARSQLSDSGLWDSGFQFGDWLDPAAPPDDPFAARADPGVVATACLARSAAITAQSAELLGRGDVEELREFARQIRHDFRANYVQSGRIVSDAPTVYALAITFGLLDEHEVQAAGDRLAQLSADADYRISTGFAGTPFILDALTRTGHLDVAYRLLMQRHSPSWLYSVTMGATTVWERWDSMLPDGSINPGQMTSFNHYALGAVADWMHRTVAGISPLSPGYERILFAPRPGGGLDWARSSLKTKGGAAGIQWRLEADALSIEILVPHGSVGVFSPPDGSEQTSLLPGTHRFQWPLPNGSAF